MNVYVVTRYDEVLAVFSTIELAKVYVEHYKPDGEIAEFPVDPAPMLGNGIKQYYVAIRDGRVINSYQVDIDDDETARERAWMSSRETFSYSVLATDIQGAEEKAFRRYQQSIEDETMDVIIREYVAKQRSAKW